MKISENELINLEDECRYLAGECGHINGPYPYLYREIIDWTRDDISYDELNRDKGVHVSADGSRTRIPYNEYISELIHWKRCLEFEIETMKHGYSGIMKL